MPAGRSGGKGQDSGEWALISSRDVRVPGVKVRAGDRAGTPERSQACFLPFTSWGSWTRGPFGQQPVSLAEPVLPWEGVLSLCKQGGWSHSPWPTLQNSSLEKNYSLSRAEHLGISWWVRPSEAFCLPRAGRRETQAQLLLPSWLPRRVLRGRQLPLPPSPESLEPAQLPSVHVPLHPARDSLFSGLGLAQLPAGKWARARA